MVNDSLRLSLIRMRFGGGTRLSNPGNCLHQDKCEMGDLVQNHEGADNTDSSQSQCFKDAK